MLERLTHRTVRLHRGHLDLPTGSYLKASARWRAADDLDGPVSSRQVRDDGNMLLGHVHHWVRTLTAFESRHDHLSVDSVQRLNQRV